jgi:hypothetical protein
MLRRIRYRCISYAVLSDFMCSCPVLYPQSYNWLRKSANLILNLLSLMGDAGINDISKRSDLPKVLMKVEDKFRLDLTGTLWAFELYLSSVRRVYTDRGYSVDGVMQTSRRSSSSWA